MSYLFDDASSQRLAKTGALGMFSFSCWFYPDDSAATCTLYSEHNATGTIHSNVYIDGGVDDRVVFESFLAEARSTGTVNYNAWNHVYAARGVADPTKAYISLNGESLVTGRFTSGGATTGTAIGVQGTTTRFNYMSGRIAEVGVWNNCLNDFDDGYKGLALGYVPPLVPVDPNASFGLGSLNLIAYAPLIGNRGDLVNAHIWTSPSLPTVAEHCRMHKQYAA